MTSPYKELAQRQINAQNEFINSIAEQFNFSARESEKIFNVYLKLKVIKYSNGSGRYLLSHGAFWDKSPMINALHTA